MSKPFRSGLVLVAAAMLAAGAMPASGAAGPDMPSTPPTPSATTGTSSTITLLTGDVVHITTTPSGRQAVTVDSAPSSTGGVRTFTVGDDLYVVPDAAEKFIAAGTVDDQLFNVTKLLEYGYDDAGSDTIPMIATYASHARSARAVSGAEIVRPLPSINGAALAADKDDAEDVWSALTVGTSAVARSGTGSTGTLGHGLEKLWLDGRVETTLDVSVPQVHAPEAWAAGFDGSGVTVAVLDTGIDAEHPDVAGALTEAVSFVPGDDVTDVNGHGTHVASTVLGSGAASGGKYKGVAPGAELKVGKVLGDDGYGQNSWLIAGMEWAAANADVVNMSLGDPDYTDGKDPMSKALNRLTEQTGTLFVVAAGNSGTEGSIGSPGAADLALTVGAVDDNDVRTWFSSMGPRTGDAGMKPDLAAPGQGIVAARSQYAAGEGAYQSMDGTSMAAPHVAGAAAIVRAAHPEWSATDVKDALMSSTDALAGATPYELGTGRLNVASALDDVYATGSTFFGLFDWPHEGPEPTERTVTYTNAGDSDVTLTLDAEVSGPDGSVDLVSLSAGEITVPAGESVDVAATADPYDVGSAGRYTGFVVATDADGSVVTRTATALVKEEERYDVDITVLDRNGEPASGAVYFYRYGELFMSALPLDPETGKAPTQRIEPGIVNATVFLDVEGSEGPNSEGVALLGEPHVQVDGDVELVFDARDAVEVTVETPKASIDHGKRMQYFHDSGIGGPFATFSATYGSGPDVQHVYAVPTGPVDGGRYDFAMMWQRSAPLLNLDAFVPGWSAIDPLYQRGSARLDGRVSLAGVHAGVGTPESYANLDANGKAVVVSRSDAVNPFDRAAAADAAGAALLVVVNNGPGTLYEPAGGTDVPVVSVTASQGATLVQAAERGRLRFRGMGMEFSPYMYTISKSWPGEIPAELEVAPEEDDLARLDTRFIDSEERLAFGTTYDCRDYQWPPCLGFTEPQGTQTERTDYVSTYEGNSWYQGVSHIDGWEQRGVNRTYEPGEVVEVDWFSPVVRPRLGDGYWGSRHDGSWFAVNVPPSSGPGGITGSRGQGYDDRIETRLFQNDTLIRTSPSQAIQTRVPDVDGPATYRFEYDTVALEGDPWVNSTRTRTSWTFVADQASDPSGDDGWTYLPLLQLDYDVDIAVDGTARAERRDVIGVSAGHEPGVVGAGDFEGVTLEISYDDGATWIDVELRPGGGEWTGRVKYPRDAEFVSLRATGWDDAGNRVEQEVVRAYALD